MPIGLAITAILSLALSIAFLRFANDMKTYRLRWMDLIGVLDVDCDRELRKRQERQMSLMSGILFLMFAALSASCTYWTLDEIRESRREKSTIEREMDMAQKEIQGMKMRIGGRR